MHDVDLTTQVGFGLSVHPNRGIVDAALSVSRGGHQASVFASGPLSRDRDTRVGPLRVEVIEPMRVLRVVLEEHDGLAADLTFTGVTQHIEDGRMRRDAGARLISERIRTVQFGQWHSRFTMDGETVECTPDLWWGFRDRSWGSRTTGTVAESAMPAHASGIYFAWTLLRFPDECLLVAVNETPDGRSEARTAAVLPFLRDGEPTYGEEGKVLRGDVFAFDIDYLPGTRRPRQVGLTVGLLEMALARARESTPGGAAPDLGARLSGVVGERMVADLYRLGVRRFAVEADEVRPTLLALGQAATCAA